MNNSVPTNQLEKSREFWLGKINGEITELNITPDFVKHTGEYNEGEVLFSLNKELGQKLLAISKNNYSMAFVVMLAALKVVLKKYTSENEIIVGSLTYGDEDSNAILFKDDISKELTMKELITKVRMTVSEAYENQGFELERLLEHLGGDKNSISPLKVMMVLDNIQDAKVLGRIVKEHSVFYTLSMSINGDDVSGKILYNKNLFSCETIKLLSTHYCHVMEQMFADLNSTIKSIDILTSNEKNQVLCDFNQTDAAYPMDKTVHGLFEEQAQRTPDNIAVSCGEKKISYGELNSKANRLGNYVRDHHDIKSDGLIGIVMEKSIDMIIAAIGVMKAGAAYVPIDPDYPEERIRTILNDAGIQVVISSGNNIKVLNRLQWECPTFNAFILMDADDVYELEEETENELMSEQLWEYVGNKAEDDIQGGAWTSSYTGEDISKKEMDEYGENILEKLRPYLHKEARILEIGCASGLSMYRIAPNVGFYYGTDLSKVIIEKNKKRIKDEGITNITVAALAAHDIDKIEENDFDIVIINSVIQAFHGHNYLRKVLKKAINLMSDKGIMFLGDIMDHDLKQSLIDEMYDFKQKNPQYKTRTDWDAELFVSRGFLSDLKFEMGAVVDVKFSNKICTIENELTKFRYDAIADIDKNGSQNVCSKKNKHQIGIKEINDCSSENVVSGAKPDNTVYVIYTSGTTGKPKGAMISHKNVVRLMVNDKMLFDFNQNDVWTMFHSFCFDFSVWEMYGALLFGGKLVIIPKIVAMNTGAYLQLLKDEKVTVLNQTPSAFYNLIEEEMKSDSKDLSIRYVIFGGEALKPLMLKGFAAKYPKIRLVNMYGITETTVHVTYKEITEYEIENNISNIGKPIPTLKTYILDSDLKLLPVGIPGELCVGGDGVCKGYLNRQELTKEKFVDDMFAENAKLYRSGDLARFLPNGEMEYLGRIDHQVKIRGFRIELGEIESQLLKHDSIREVVVVPHADQNGERLLCAYYVSDHEIAVSDLREFLKRELPEYMVPSHFVKLEKIPLTPNGKVKRSALPDPMAGVYTGVAFVAPRNDAEKRLLAIYQSILGVEGIGINDNFFDLGGHSLKATVLMARIHKEFNVSITLTDIFKMPVLKDLADFISSSSESRYSSIKKVEPRAYYPLSSAQKRLFAINQIEGENTGYNMPNIMIVEGELDKERFINAINVLVKRHEALRTSFKLIDEKPAQMISTEVDFEVVIEEAQEGQSKELVEKFIRPFDLSRAPLFRAQLIKLSTQKYLFMIDMHHIVSDGVSMDVLVSDFVELYDGEKLSEPRIQYKDFAVWQQEQVESGAVKKQEEYWLDVFKGDIPKLNMPVDFERPEFQSFEGGSIEFTTDRDTADRLGKIAQDSGATMYMVVLAGYNVLLSKYSGQDDILVGCPIAGRLHADLENVVGMFVNTLVMRNRPEKKKSFLSFLDDVRINSIGAFENQDCQFEELVAKLGIKRDPSRNPLIDTALIFQNFASANNTKEIKGLRFTQFEHLYNITKFDFSIQAYEFSDGIGFYIEYCTKLFKESTMKKFSEDLISVLKQIAENPDIKIGEIQLEVDCVGVEETSLDFEDFNF